MLVAVLHFLLADDRPAEVVAELLDAMPVGSYLVISHATADPVDYATRAAWDQAIASGQHGAFQHRSKAEILDLFGGWELLSPGLVPVADWGLNGTLDSDAPFADAAAYGGLAINAPKVLWE
jgi:hypothetical protein